MTTPHTGDTILRPDRIVTGGDGGREVLEHTEILVRGGLIAELRPAGAADERADGTAVRVIALPGACVMPGFVDAHVHLGFDSTMASDGSGGVPDRQLLLRMAENARKLVSVGVTTVRELGARGFLDVTLRDAIDTGIAVGPRIRAATRPITQTGGHCWYMGGEADDEAGIRRVARENFRGGADGLKIMATGGNLTNSVPLWKSQYSAREIRVAVEEAQAKGGFIAAHAHGVDGIRAGISAGVTSIEHCSFMGEQGLAGVATPDPRVVDDIAEAGIMVCPTMSGGMWRLRAGLGPWLEGFLARLAAFRRHGVRLAVGTDSGLQSGDHPMPVDAYVDGLRLLDAAGWSMPEILTAATSGGAEACGLSGKTGVVRVGSSADLVALDGDPLAGLDAWEKVRMVMVGGRRVTQNGVDSVASSVGR
ncbi:amidohydrolase family protein [Tomitella fengzijianii]|uniref:amidohydrolase family protein n=1 Tax=Tomitella fengzijianii TaxID=2597660 RepID=UPI00131D0CAA|nr:amidohydrolase family protein [Tomitella fengzijianii]